MNHKYIITIMDRLSELEACIMAIPKPTIEEIFLTSDQMERLLKCSPATLYRLRNKGIIPCSKIGGQYRYPKNFFTQEVINSIVKGEDPSKKFDDK